MSGPHGGFDPALAALQGAADLSRPAESLSKAEQRRVAGLNAAMMLAQFRSGIADSPHRPGQDDKRDTDGDRLCKDAERIAKFLDTGH